MNVVSFKILNPEELNLGGFVSAATNLANKVANRINNASGIYTFDAKAVRSRLDEGLKTFFVVMSRKDSSSSFRYEYPKSRDIAINLKFSSGVETVLCFEVNATNKTYKIIGEKSAGEDVKAFCQEEFAKLGILLNNM